MIKEFIICIIIIMGIFIGNGMTQGYSKDSIESMNQNLETLEEMTSKGKSELTNEEKEKIKITEENISKQWEEMFNRLAYYIEHEELEKFSKNLENIKTYLKIENYENATKEIGEGIFILNHIEEKYSFDLQNIF